MAVAAATIDARRAGLHLPLGLQEQQEVANIRGQKIAGFSGTALGTSRAAIETPDGSSLGAGYRARRRFS